MQNLSSKHCVPCEGGVAPLTNTQIQAYMPGLSLSWKVIEGKKIQHQFIFKNFPSAIGFIDKIVPVAESEGHHPDIHVYYNKVTIELWTHAIGGLSENDFIMAAKIEQLV